jgi:hypothetical protein
VDRFTEAGWLAILVRDISIILVDLGMPPIPVIPRDPITAREDMEAVDVISERM